MQSHARTRVRGERSGREERRVDSQSRGRIRILDCAAGSGACVVAAGFALRFLADLGWRGRRRLVVMLRDRDLKTYCWSVAMYFEILGERARATMPDTPQPSSRTVEEELRMRVWKRMLVWEDIQSASKGVIFQTTARGYYFKDRDDTCNEGSKFTRSCCAFFAV